MTLSHLIGLTSWEQGCGQAFLGDSLRSPRPSDLLACQLVSRRKDHGQMSIITSVCFGQNRAGLPVGPRPAEPCQPEWKNVVLYGEIKIDPANLKMRGS